MNVGSLFSGIGGLDLGLARAGFRHAFFCEGGGDPNGTREERQQWAQGKWRRTVLAHHWPGVPIYEDVRDVQLVGGHIPRRVAGAQVELRGRVASDEAAGAVDLLCGGFPCQDVSVAGRRRGLAGERSGLFHEFARIAESLRPRWLLVENVPGLLSSNGGRDFGVVLGTLADIGYGVGWRIVDSRFFGVPQRRRRVFIVGALADGDTRAAAERAGEVLAVGTRCPGHPATGAEARENAAVASLSGLGSGGPDDNDGQGGRLVSHALNGKRGNRDDGESETFIASPLEAADGHHGHSSPRGDGADNLVAFHAYGGAGRDSMLGASEPGLSPNLKRKGQVAVAHTLRANERNNSNPAAEAAMHVYQGASVRRLTPTECERLQALPDDWTDFGPDSRRYAALGDAVTASVSEWIGRRLIAHGI